MQLARLFSRSSCSRKTLQMDAQSAVDDDSLARRLGVVQGSVGGWLAILGSPAVASSNPPPASTPGSPNDGAAGSVMTSAASPLEVMAESGCMYAEMPVSLSNPFLGASAQSLAGLPSIKASTSLSNSSIRTPWPSCALLQRNKTRERVSHDQRSAVHHRCRGRVGPMNGWNQGSQTVHGMGLPSLLIQDLRLCAAILGLSHVVHLIGE